jgi:hypothetical protein
VYYYNNTGVMMEGNQGEKETEKTKYLSRKSEIYRKALDLFVKNGYDATSMSMIAKTAGLSKASLYYYCTRLHQQREPSLQNSLGGFAETL